MISSLPNPALEALVEQIAPELVLVEVWLRRTGSGFELRHVSDRNATGLREVAIVDLRCIAQSTERGQFRPLKCAPNLPCGWRCEVVNLRELEFALHHLYPGAVADWFAVRQANLPVTHYREFTARQSGLYRVTTTLDDEQAGQVARIGCHPCFCLKRRLWTVPGCAPDSAKEKSLIPCLEPCPVLLEFARAAARLHQREREGLLPMLPAVEAAGSGVREADFAAPANPRMRQLVLERTRERINIG